MPHVARNYSQYLGTVVGSGHCVDLVQICSTVGHTCRTGAAVTCVRGDVHLRRRASSRRSTYAGQYANATDGSSHAAILLGEEVNGLLVQEQYVGQPTHHRLISFRNGEGDACNDGDRVTTVQRLA